MKASAHTSTSGLSLLELTVALALSALTLFGLSQLLFLSQKSRQSIDHKTEFVSLMLTVDGMLQSERNCSCNLRGKSLESDPDGRVTTQALPIELRAYAGDCIASGLIVSGGSKPIRGVRAKSVRLENFVLTSPSRHYADLVLEFDHYGSQRRLVAFNVARSIDGSSSTIVGCGDVGTGQALIAYETIYKPAQTSSIVLPLANHPDAQFVLIGAWGTRFDKETTTPPWDEPDHESDRNASRRGSDLETYELVVYPGSGSFHGYYSFSGGFRGLDTTHYQFAGQLGDNPERPRVVQGKDCFPEPGLNLVYKSCKVEPWGDLDYYSNRALGLTPRFSWTANPRGGPAKDLKIDGVSGGGHWDQSWSLRYYR